MVAVGEHCRKLTNLSLRFCDRYHVVRLIFSMPSFCQDPTANFVLALSGRLDLFRIGDDALIGIGQGCNMLRHLNVSGCYKVGDAGIISIADGCPLLTHLDIGVCQVFLVMLTVCVNVLRRSLRLMIFPYLVYDVLQNVGDLGLAAMGNGCPQLKEIVLSHCRKITDAGLSFLVSRCTKLESCQMVYCPAVTSVGVATVVAGCIHIKQVLVERWKVTARTRRRAAPVLTELGMDL